MYTNSVLLIQRREADMVIQILEEKKKKKNIGPKVNQNSFLKASTELTIKVYRILFFQDRYIQSRKKKQSRYIQLM